MGMRMIIIDGEPVAKARPRITRSGHGYTPSKTRDAEQAIATEWRREHGLTLSEKPLRITLIFNMKRPKRKPTKHVQKRPDIDNLIKTVLDALNGVAYVDDKQIYSLTANKQWADGKPHTVVILSEVEA